MASTDVISAVTETRLTQTAGVQNLQSRPKKQKTKKTKQPTQQQAQSQKAKNKVEKPFYQTLGEELLASTRPEKIIRSLPQPDLSSIPLPPIPSCTSSPFVNSTPSGEKNPFFAGYDAIPQSRSVISLHWGRRSEDSNLSGSTRVSREEYRLTPKQRTKGAIYKLDDFSGMNQTELLVMRYGRVAHMGVRDPSYSFWMNETRTAVVHFKVLNKVAILGGDPLCHPDRMSLSMKEFESYCKSAGWRISVIGASESMAAVAKSRGWTTMRFGTETVLNPQTNEVLLGKSGKRIITQCKQLLDPARGGISIHTYCPSLGRDANLETELRTIYDDWRHARNATRESQAFITVFDMFAMSSLMTFLYTKDRQGRINGFAALRKLGANDGYHIDPFIQTADAPRGVSDLLIFSSLAFLNANGVSCLSLGFEPLPDVGEISGIFKAFQPATRKVYKHVFGKIPVGGKEAFHARWKPDTSQESPVYLIFVGRIPSPRFMVAMTHYANISLRSIIKQDLELLRRGGKKEDSNKDTANGNDLNNSKNSSSAATSIDEERAVVSEPKQKLKSKRSLNFNLNLRLTKTENNKTTRQMQVHIVEVPS